MHAPVASRTPFSLLRQTATGPGDAMRQMPDPKNECNQISRGVKWVAGAQGGAPSRGPRGVRSRNTYDKLRHAEKYAFETDNFELEVIG